MLFIGVNQSSIIALGTDGVISWQQLRNPLTLDQFLTTEDRLVVGEKAGALAALGHNGGDLWRAEDPAFVPSRVRNFSAGPVLNHDGRIWVAHTDVWHVDQSGVGDRVVVTPHLPGVGMQVFLGPVFDDTANAYLVAGGLWVVSLDHLGRHRWTQRIPGGMPASRPAVGRDGSIIVGAQGITAYSRSGALLWTWQDAETRFPFSHVRPLANGGVVALGENFRLLVGRDASGRSWTGPTQPMLPVWILTDEDSNIFYPSSAGTSIEALSSEGQLLWRVELQAPIASELIMDSKGRLVFVDSRNTLVKLEDA